MELLKTIRDDDIGSAVPSPSAYKERRASRAVVFDANKRVALLHATKKEDFHKLPGGGIEDREDIATALDREVREEIGCVISNVRELGIIEEYRNGFSLHQISYCFIADVAGEKGEPQLMEDELADGFETTWLDLPAAIQMLESEAPVENYEGKFIQLRDLTFLKEAARMTE